MAAADLKRRGTVSCCAPTVVSLFCGCGGFDHGFERAGFRSLGSFDIDPVALDVHRENLKGPVFRADLGCGIPSGAVSENPDVLLAGPPCQGFSTLGQRQSDDPRNELLLAAGRLAVAMRPRIVVVENVAGVLAGALSRYWDNLNLILRQASYSTKSVIVEATEVGLPQRRRRVLLFGWRSDIGLDISLSTGRTSVLGDVLRQISGTKNHAPVPLPVGSTGAMIAARISPGQKLSNVRGGWRSVHTWEIPEVFGRTSAKERLVLQGLMRERRRMRSRSTGDGDPVSLARLRKSFGAGVDGVLSSLVRKEYVRLIGGRFDLAHTFNGRYRRLTSDAPAATVDTKFGDPRLFLHPNQHRGFTVREAARLQGFPDDFHFSGSLRQQFSLVGNAVPPPLAQVIALRLRAALQCADRK